jgi:Na+/melibiose symporter-like transporter
MERLGASLKHAFGVGQIAEGVKNTAFNTFLLFYFNQVLGLPGTAAGLALFIATAIDALSDPIVGSFSDRFVHRWGRRHPFMYVSALPLGVCFALLWQPPAGLGEAGLFGWLLGFSVLTRQSMTFFHVPHMALGAELTTDYRERTTVVAYRTAYGLLGVVVTIAGAWSVFFRSTPAFPNGQYAASAYPAFGVVFGALIAASVVVSALGTHARIPRLPQPAGAPERIGLALLLRDYRGALANSSFRPFFVGLVIFFIVRGIQDVLGIYMTTYFWRLDPAQIQSVSLAALPGAVIGIPVWAAISARTDKRPTFLAGVILFSVFVFAPPMAKLAGWYPAHDHAAYLPLLSLLTALAAFGAVAGLVVSGSMLADIADEHELATGRRQEGVFFGALAFAVKSSSGLGTFFAGIGLDLIAFPAKATLDGVGPETVRALAILYGPGIALLAAIGVVFLARYRIDHARHQAIMRELALRRAGAPPQSP